MYGICPCLLNMHAPRVKKASVHSRSDYKVYRMGVRDRPAANKELVLPSIKSLKTRARARPVLCTSRYVLIFSKMGSWRFAALQEVVMKVEIRRHLEGHRGKCRLPKLYIHRTNAISSYQSYLVEGRLLCSPQCHGHSYVEDLYSTSSVVSEGTTWRNEWRQA